MDKVVKSISHTLKNYLTFSGHASRGEFWTWLIVTGVISQIIFFVEIFLLEGHWIYYLYIDKYADITYSWTPIRNFFLLMIFLPTLSITIRRIRSSAFRPYWLLLWYLYRVVLTGTILIGFPFVDIWNSSNALGELRATLNTSLNPIDRVFDLFGVIYLFSNYDVGESIALMTAVISVFVAIILSTLLIILTRNDSAEYKLLTQESTQSEEIVPPQPNLEDLEVVEEKPPEPATTICTDCGSISPDRAVNCISCGKQLPFLFCPNCQTENIPQAKFCAGCGQVR